MIKDYEYIFNKDNCIYKTVCSSFNTPKCNKQCLRYMEMDYLFYTSGLPKSKRRPIALRPEVVDEQAYDKLLDIKTNIKEFVENGKSLYIYSNNTGNGKTSWAIKMLNKYFNDICIGNCFRPRGLFISVPNFLRQVTENVQNPTEDFIELKQLIKKVDLVIWDDIGANKLSEYDHKNLLSFIDQRILEEKANIYTGNLSGKQLVQAVGNRLASRIYNNSQVVELVGSDRRGL